MRWMSPLVTWQRTGNRRTTALLVQQTGLAVHALPEPTPTTLMGEQPTPSSPVRSPRTMPKRPARAFASFEVDCSDNTTLVNMHKTCKAQRYAR